MTTRAVRIVANGPLGRGTKITWSDTGEEILGAIAVTIDPIECNSFVTATIKFFAELDITAAAAELVDSQETRGALLAAGFVHHREGDE